MMVDDSFLWEEGGGQERVVRGEDGCVHYKYVWNWQKIFKKEKKRSCRVVVTHSDMRL